MGHKMRFEAPVSPFFPSSRRPRPRQAPPHSIRGPSSSAWIYTATYTGMTRRHTSSSPTARAKTTDEGTLGQLALHLWNFGPGWNSHKS